MKNLLRLTTVHRKKWHNTTFYRYQNRVWLKVVSALVDNLLLTQDVTEADIEAMETVEIPIEYTRQSGKTTSIVHTVEDIMIFLTRTFRRPLAIGIFAPQKEQAKTDFDRLKTALEKTRKDLVVIDHDLERRVKEESNSKTIVIGNGSSCYIFPVNQTSKPESKTLDLIIIEESQDVNDTIIKQQVLPMGASTNAPVVRIGTAGIRLCDFYWLIQRGLAYVMQWREIAADRRRIYELTGDPRHLIYEQHVKNLIAKYGEESDEIARPYNNKWLIGQGMFITYGELQACRITRPYEYPENDTGYHQYREWFTAGSRTAAEIDAYAAQHATPPEKIALWRTWCEDSHYFGLDTAKSQDQTVLKIGRMIGDKLTIVRSVEGLRGVNYEDQFEVLLSVLKWFNIAAGSIDSTGQGDFMPDKFERNTGYLVYRIKFSLMSKDQMYKALYQKLVNKLFGYFYQDPAKLSTGGVELSTAQSVEQFETEMVQLVKEQKGNYMAVSHPDDANAHDDHPDATALMANAFDSYNVSSGLKQFYEEQAKERAG